MFRRPVVVRRRGSPLLTTAAVGGVAYAAGKRGAEQEQAQAQATGQASTQTAVPSPQAAPSPTQPGQQAAPQEAPQAASSGRVGSDKLDQLKQLGDLRASGVLTDAEFEAEKQKILQS
jgi:Short C-terminal domain